MTKRVGTKKRAHPTHYPLPCTMAKKHLKDGTGPFRADQLKDGDRYELSGGHPVYCAPAGRDHAGHNLTGASVLDSDPDVEWAGVDAGFAPEPGTLRAPDVAIAAPGDARGWIPGVPPLAVEYAAQGQDEKDLQRKITELLENGTRQIWGVRLIGPRRIEVYAPEQPLRVLGPGDLLDAPGILRNPVPVEALYDRRASHKATLRNLLQREGYEDLDAVLREGREKGREEGLAESILILLRGRGITIPADVENRVTCCRDTTTLKTWLLAAARAERAEAIFSTANMQ